MRAWLARLAATAWLLAAFFALPAVAHAAAQWQSGPLAESTGSNCVTGAPEYFAGSWLSYYADPANPPKTGEIYYLAVDVGGVGNPCAGQYADVELNLPSGTTTAISSSHPVQCFLEFPGQSSFVQDASSDCPQVAQSGAYLGLAFNPVGVNPPFWPLPQGGTVEIHVPVVSSAPLNGTSKFVGTVALADGESNPILHPTLAVIVDDAATQTGQSQIGVFYPTPSITGQSMNGNGSVNVNIIGYVENHSNPGTAVAELGQPPAGAGTDCTNPVGPKGNPGGGIFDTSSVPLATGGTNLQTQISGNFTNLYPGHAYCWRIKALVGPVGQRVEYDGNWEPFVTQGSPLPSDGTMAPTVPTSNCSASTGNGCAAASCSAAASCAPCSGAACLTTFAPGQTNVVAGGTPPPGGGTPPSVLPPTAHHAKLARKGRPRAKRSGRSIRVTTGLVAACPAGGAACPVKLTATVSGAQASKQRKRTKTVTVGTLRTSVRAGRSRALTFKLTTRGARLLAKHRKLRLKLTIQAGVTKHATIRITEPKPKKKRH